MVERSQSSGKNTSAQKRQLPVSRDAYARRWEAQEAAASEEAQNAAQEQLTVRRNHRLQVHEHAVRRAQEAHQRRLGARSLIEQQIVDRARDILQQELKGPLHLKLKDDRIKSGKRWAETGLDRIQQIGLRGIESGRRPAGPDAIMKYAAICEYDEARIKAYIAKSAIEAEERHKKIKENMMNKMGGSEGNGEFGRALREARRKAGLSLTDVSRQTGISLGTLSGAERGLIGEIKDHKLAQLLRIISLPRAVLPEWVVPQNKGQYLQRLRANAGLSPADLNRLSGIDSQVFTQMEKGRTTVRDHLVTVYEQALGRQIIFPAFPSPKPSREG